ncbi:MAG: ABC transporter substrate-binding protein [Candidatus Omnitrophica bacterium]|nr:ABC transporter substrate-binding protein [Candidatus Omnitrophota bacterium]
MKRNIYLFFIGIFLVACVNGFTDTNKQHYTIKVGVSPVVSSAGVFLAKEKGYFDEQGIDVDIIYFKKSGAPMTILLTNGSLDVGGGNISAGLWNAIISGMNIKLVADKGHIEKATDYIGLLVRKDLIESGQYKNFGDLKNMRMGLTAFGVSQQIASDNFLIAGGLGLDDVTFEIMAYSQMNVALEHKLLDATVQLEPYLTKAQMDGIAVKVAGVNTVYPDQQSAAIFYSPQFAGQHPDLAEKFMIAYLKGVRAYIHAFVKGVEKDETIALLQKHIKIESPDIWNNMIPIGLNPDGFLIKKSLKNDAAWYYKYGYIERIPDVEKAIDHHYVKKALLSIGKYDR